MKFGIDMEIGKIIGEPCFDQMKGQFVASSMGNWMEDKLSITLRQLQEQNPTWYSEDILYGILRLWEIALEGRQYVYPVTPQVNLIQLPAKKRNYKEFAILMAGGAYGAVCTMVEALPVAARLNELGMDCFCLNYRTATKECFIEGLMPKPLEDLADAWYFIRERESLFGVSADCYITGGFSAGGHLAAMWGTRHLGARCYGIPNPKMLLLAYPLLTMENQQGAMAEMLSTGLFGSGYKQEKLLMYAVNHHVDDEYPAVYLCQSKDDSTVPIKDSYDMELALQSAGVSFRIERIAAGGHGFGLGTLTEADGWPDRVLKFMEECTYS